MKITRNHGFTRIELTTAIGIMLLMMVPLLPAVQKAREDARQTHCKNQLKQLGFAMHNYHEIYNLFPPSWISRRMEGEGHPSNGWQAAILPFVDYAALYNDLSESHHIYENPNQDLLKTEVVTYRCPADSLPAENSMRGGWGSSSYSGCYGARPIPRWSGSYATQSFWPGQAVISNPLKTEKQELIGVFVGANQRSGFRDIKDGTTNTIMIGEKSVLSGGGIWPGPRSNFHESDVVSDASYASPINQSETGFSSRHPGVFNVVMGDGSVRSISTSIESLPRDATAKRMGVFQMLASRADGYQIGTF